MLLYTLTVAGIFLGALCASSFVLGSKSKGIKWGLLMSATICAASFLFGTVTYFMLTACLAAMGLLLGGMLTFAVKEWRRG